MIIPANHKKIVKAYAFKAARQFYAAGAHSLQTEDIEQELWITYCKMREAYNEVIGVPFEAYLRIGLKRQVHNLRRELFQNLQTREWTVSLDKQVDDEDDRTIGDIVPSPDPTPDAIVNERQMLAHIKRNLSPRARTFVHIMVEQPSELMDEILRTKQRADYAKAIGVHHSHNVNLTSAVVFKLMGADRVERTKILREIRKLGEKMVSA